jgi:hypothetical protein
MNEHYFYNAITNNTPTPHFYTSGCRSGTISPQLASIKIARPLKIQTVMTLAFEK